MGLKKLARRVGDESGYTAAVQIICLSAVFVLGMAGGYCYAASCGDDSLLVLSAYLDDYCALYGEGMVQTISLLTVIRLYYFPVALAFLLGFTPVGIVALPVLSAACGFLMSFSVSCFVQVYGRTGIWPALAVFAPRAVVTIPCFLWVAAYSWSAVCWNALGPRGKRCTAVRRDGAYYYRLCLCVVFLMAGVCVERYLVPHLFRLAIGRI